MSNKQYFMYFITFLFLKPKLKFETENLKLNILLYETENEVILMIKKKLKKKRKIVIRM